MTQNQHPSDQELESLVENFCSQKQNTPAHKIATYQLLRVIQRLPNLTRNYALEQSQDFEEILNETLLEVFNQICEEFNPDPNNYINSLTNWINYQLRLYYKPKDKLREVRRHNIFSLDRYIGREEHTTFLDLLEDNHPDVNTLDSLIEQAQQQRQQRFGVDLWQYLEADPDNRLKNCFSSTSSQCNCHWLVQRRLLSDPPVSWQAIADELAIPYGTVTAHWHKRCKPLLRQIAQEIEQQLQEEI